MASFQQTPWGQAPFRRAHVPHPRNVQTSSPTCEYGLACHDISHSHSNAFKHWCEVCNTLNVIGPQCSLCNAPRVIPATPQAVSQAPKKPPCRFGSSCYGIYGTDCGNLHPPGTDVNRNWLARQQAKSRQQQIAVPAAGTPLQQPPCRYGASCTRQNPKHLQDFHPEKLVAQQQQAQQQQQPQQLAQQQLAQLQAQQQHAQQLAQQQAMLAQQQAEHLRRMTEMQQNIDTQKLLHAQKKQLQMQAQIDAQNRELELLEKMSELQLPQELAEHDNHEGAAFFPTPPAPRVSPIQSSAGHSKPKFCVECGSPVTGKFCASCGHCH